MSRPLALPLAAMILGLVLTRWWQLPPGLPLFGAALAVAAWWVYRSRPGAVILILLGFLLAGLFWGGLSGLRQSGLDPGLAGTRLTITGTVVERPVRYPNRVVLMVMAGDVAGRPVRERIQVVIYSREKSTTPQNAPALGRHGTDPHQPLYRYGSVLKITGQLQEIPTARNPGELDYRAYLARRGIFYRLVTDTQQVAVAGQVTGNPLLFMADLVRQRVEEAANRYMHPKGAAVLLGVMLGERERLDAAQVDLFHTLGVAHLFAVSGLHVGLVALFVAGLCRMMGVSRRGTVVAGLAGLLFYAALAGFTPSVVRAALMTGLGFIAYALGRERDYPTALLLAALLILLWRPESWVEAGFQLSFAGAWGMVYLFPLARATGSRMGWADWLAVSVAAQTATLPLVAYHFNILTLLAVPANVVAVPVIGVVVSLGMAAMVAATVWIPLAAPLLVAVNLLADGVTFFLSLLNTIPGAAWRVPTPSPVLVIAYFLVLIVIREMVVFRDHPRVRYLAMRWAGLLAVSALAVVLGITAWIMRPAPMVITMLDVGQGSAIHLRTPAGADLLLDGGGSRRTGSTFDIGEDILVPYLIRRGAARVEVVASSHPDTDHLQGLEAVIKRLPVQLVITPGAGLFGDGYLSWLSLVQDRKVPAVEVGPGSRVAVDPWVEVSILGPLPGLKGDNNNSLVVKAVYRNFSILFTGDIEQEAMAALVASGQDLQSTLMVLPHHGSRTGLYEPFLAAVNPQAVIVQAGANNPYGHPAPEVLEFWQRRGVPVYRTDLHGAVTVRTDGHRWWVNTVIPVAQQGTRWRWRGFSFP